ncbi:hypothetical protein PAHAL_4G247300 [Panicum hallii]|uniref:Secreted protein n=1 Tax=Panicum hallii TaxID=206008 RepID=A0A2T8JDV1_9POAL|nr:uncharacterized protein LOC112889147 [Panicum hallii]PVH48097.1 hypothetical protein PAHAL_4G247300 [Panicum hallii]
MMRKPQGSVFVFVLSMMCRSGPGTRPTIACSEILWQLLGGMTGSGHCTGRPVQGVPSFRGNIRRSRGIMMDFGQGRQGVHVLEVTATARATSLPGVVTAALPFGKHGRQGGRRCEHGGPRRELLPWWSHTKEVGDLPVTSPPAKRKEAEKVRLVMIRATRRAITLTRTRRLSICILEIPFRYWLF